MIETVNLLLMNHIGGRKGHSCEIAIHGILSKIHQAWSEANAQLYFYSISQGLLTISYIEDLSITSRSAVSVDDRAFE